jgi:phage terminase small subunit
MSLTPKQQRFVDEYLVDLNATQAAIRAGYSADTARQIASEILSKPDIQEAVAAGQERIKDRVELTQEMVVRELMKIAFGTQRNLMTWGPGGVSLRDSSELTDDEAAMVSEVSETTTISGGSLKLKTHDKVGALKLLGDHLGLFMKRLEVTGQGGKPIAYTSVTPEQLAEAVRGVRDQY